MDNTKTTLEEVTLEQLKAFKPDLIASIVKEVEVRFKDEAGRDEKLQKAESDAKTLKEANEKLTVENKDLKEGKAKADALASAATRKTFVEAESKRIKLPATVMTESVMKFCTDADSEEAITSFLEGLKKTLVDAKVVDVDNPPKGDEIQEGEDDGPKKYNRDKFIAGVKATS